MKSNLTNEIKKHSRNLDFLTKQSSGLFLADFLEFLVQMEIVDEKKLHTKKEQQFYIDKFKSLTEKRFAELKDNIKLPQSKMDFNE